MVSVVIFGSFSLPYLPGTGCRGSGPAGLLSRLCPGILRVILRVILWVGHRLLRVGFGLHLRLLGSEFRGGFLPG